MKKIVIVIFAILVLPGVVLAQESGSMRAELEQARQAKNEKMDSISLESKLMWSALSSSRPAPLTAASQPVQKPVLHPALLSLPGRMVMTVLAPAPFAVPVGAAPTLKSPAVPLVPARPAVTIELTCDPTGNI